MTLLSRSKNDRLVNFHAAYVYLRAIRLNRGSQIYALLLDARSTAENALRSRATPPASGGLAGRRRAGQWARNPAA